jgi:hypothetical protein
MMHRVGWQGPRASSAIPFAWFVFDRDHRGPTVLQRISWAPTTESDSASSDLSFPPDLSIPVWLRRAGP